MSRCGLLYDYVNFEINELKFLVNDTQLLNQYDGVRLISQPFQMPMSPYSTLLSVFKKHVSGGGGGPLLEWFGVMS